MRVYDAPGPVCRNPQFAHLVPDDGQPALAPAQLALVTIFQFAEGLSDRQAADGVRALIDWKYALCLPLCVNVQNNLALTSQVGWRAGGRDGRQWSCLGGTAMGMRARSPRCPTAIRLDGAT